MILTKREFEVSRLFSLGFIAKEIADYMFLSKRTIETHKTNIFKKNEVINNVSDLVREFVLKFGNPKNATLLLLILITIKYLNN